VPINYSLYENHLTADPGDFAALVQTTASADLEQIAERMIAQGSTSTKADILAVLEDSVKACEGLLLEGWRVNLDGLCQLFPRVQGIFDSAMDRFDRSRHRVDIGANPGPRVRETVRQQAAVEKVEKPVIAPNPIEFHDLGSGTMNSAVTPGNIGTIDGYRLKFDRAQAFEGVYFIRVDGLGEMKPGFIQKNKPSQLVFLNPKILPAGEYFLEVRARLHGGDELRAGRLDAVLTV